MLYLFAGNIIIFNLFIAGFNNIYKEVKAISNLVWDFIIWGYE